MVRFNLWLVFSLSHCAVPANIHPPTTEVISHSSPPPPLDFPFSKYFLNPPPLRKFLKYKIHPNLRLQQCFSGLGRGFLWAIYVDFIDTEIYKHCS